MSQACCLASAFPLPVAASTACILAVVGASAVPLPPLRLSHAAGADLQLGCNKALAAAIASTKHSHLQASGRLLCAQGLGYGTLL